LFGFKIEQQRFYTFMATTTAASHGERSEGW